MKEGSYISLDLNNIYLVIDDNFVISMGMEVDCLLARGTSIQGEVRHVEIWSVTQELLCSKSRDFVAIFALAHSKINQIA